MRLSVDLSVDTARGTVRRLLASCHDCCVPLSYRIARWWRRFGLASTGRRRRNMSPRE